MPRTVPSLAGVLYPPVQYFHCTRLAVGHTFTSEYTRRFGPDLDGDEVACPCGWPVHSFCHILYDCRLHNQARFDAKGQLPQAESELSILGTETSPRS